MLLPLVMHLVHCSIVDCVSFNPNMYLAHNDALYGVQNGCTLAIVSTQYFIILIINII